MRLRRLERRHEHLFHHRPLDQDDRRICRSLARIGRRPRYRREVDAPVAHQPAVQSGKPPGKRYRRGRSATSISRTRRPAGESRASAEPSPNAYWRVRSFRNYADYALTAPFAAGLARLRERGAQQRCAIMCAEAVWWRCHRRIIADYLLAAGEHVMHILGKSHVDVASLTPGAVVRNDGTVVYPAEGPQPE